MGVMHSGVAALCCIAAGCSPAKRENENIELEAGLLINISFNRDEKRTLLLAQ